MKKKVVIVAVLVALLVIVVALGYFIVSQNSWIIDDFSSDSVYSEHLTHIWGHEARYLRAQAEDNSRVEQSIADTIKAAEMDEDIDDNLKQSVQQFLDRSSPVTSAKDAFLFASSCMVSWNLKEPNNKYALRAISHGEGEENNIFTFFFVQKNWNYYQENPDAKSFYLTIHGEKMNLLRFRWSKSYVEGAEG